MISCVISAKVSGVLACAIRFGAACSEIDLHDEDGYGFSLCLSFVTEKTALSCTFGDREVLVESEIIARNA